MSFLSLLRASHSLKNSDYKRDDARKKENSIKISSLDQGPVHKIKEKLTGP